MAGSAFRLIGCLAIAGQATAPEAVLTGVAFMGLVPDHTANIKPFSALQPYPTTLQLLHRLRGHHSALEFSSWKPL